MTNKFKHIFFFKIFKKIEHFIIRLLKKNLNNLNFKNTNSKFKTKRTFYRNYQQEYKTK